MNIELETKIIQKADFPEYLSWFKDSDINKQLGPLKKDDEWFTYVLNEQKGLTEYAGCTYSVFQNKKLVSVFGIAFPDKEEPTYTITSIAVKPFLRSKGIGKRILKKVMELHPLKKGEYWQAFVSVTNPKAELFFENNGWRCVSKSPEKNDMYIYEYKTNLANLNTA